MQLTQAQAELKNELIWTYFDFFNARNDFLQTNYEIDRQRMQFFRQKLKPLVKKANDLYGIWFTKQCKERAKGLIE